MIKNKEIYATYFESSKSVAFDQQANINEIDKLMSVYNEWEEKEFEIIKIRSIVNTLIRLLFEFNSASKEYLHRNIIQLYQKFEWKIPKDQTLLQELISELGSLSNEFYEVTDEEFSTQRQEIKNKLSKIKQVFQDVIPGEDILSPDKEYFTASELTERIEIVNRYGEVRNKPVFKIFPETLESVAKKICPTCGDEIIDFKDNLSRKEYEITFLLKFNVMLYSSYFEGFPINVSITTLRYPLYLK